MALTIDGISTTKQRGSFRTEEYYSKMFRAWMVQWDYRDDDGELHSGVAESMELARRAAGKHGYGK